MIHEEEKRQNNRSEGENGYPDSRVSQKLNGDSIVQKNPITRGTRLTDAQVTTSRE